MVSSVSSVIPEFFIRLSLSSILTMMPSAGESLENTPSGSVAADPYASFFLTRSCFILSQCPSILSFMSFSLEC